MEPRLRITLKQINIPKRRGWKVLAIFSGIFLTSFSCSNFNAQGGLGLFLLSSEVLIDSGSSSSSILSPLKAVQTGTVTMDATTKTATITAVDMTKSFVKCFHSQSSSSPAYMPACELTSSTQITVTTETAISQTVQWYLVEFSSGATVQRGSTTMGAGVSQSDITITALDTAKTFVLEETAANVARAEQARQTIRAHLTSTTNLRLDRNETGSVARVKWQVVTLEGASVQSGLKTVTGVISDTVTVSAVTMSNSFLIFNNRALAASVGECWEFFTGGVLTNSTTLTFSRGTTANSVELAWFLVELGGASVQRGTATDGNVDHTALNATLTAVDTSLSLPLISTIVSSAGNGNMDAGSYYPAFSTTTNLLMTRAGPDSVNAEVSWESIQFSQ